MKEKLLKWLRAAGVRALKTVAQTAVATIGTGAVLSEVDWAEGVLAGRASRGAGGAGAGVCRLPAWPDCRKWRNKARRTGTAPSRRFLRGKNYISGAKMRSISRAMRRRPPASHSSGAIWWQWAMVSRKSRFTSSTAPPP